MSKPEEQNQVTRKGRRGKRGGLRRFAALSLATIVVLGVAYVILGHVVSGMIRTTLAKEGLRKAGIEVTFGSLRFQPLPANVHAKDLRIRAANSDGPYLFECPELRAHLALGKLLRKRLVADVRVREPVLRLLCREDGTWNIPSLKKEPKKPTSRAAQRGRKRPRKKRLRIESADITITDGALELTDQRLQGPPILWTNMQGEIAYGKEAFDIGALSASVAEGVMSFAGTRISLGGAKPTSHLVVRAEKLEPDKAIRPFLARHLPRTHIQSAFDFEADLTISLKPRAKGQAQIADMTGTGTWTAELGVLFGPRVPDYLAEIVPGSTIERFKFLRMLGEFQAVGSRTLAQMDIKGENVGLHVHGATTNEGRMTYFVALDFRHLLATRPALEMDEDFGRLRLFTFTARIDERGKLADEKFTFEAQEVIRHFVSSNFGGILQNLTHLKALEPER